ncbi:MAG: sodium:solute symporter family protein [Thermoprotei archaeon]|nr:sodium:solute symporter family protein [Thermoprotei archaeon]
MEGLEAIIGITILLGWVFLMVIVAWLSTKYKRLSVTDFATTGGTLGLLTLFLTYSATYHSAYAFMGTTGFIHTHGLAWWDNVHWCVLPGIMFWIIGSRVWALSKKYGFISYGDYLKGVYKSGGQVATALSVAAAIVGFIFVLLYTAIQALGISYLFNVISGGIISFEEGLLIFIVLMVFITWIGGLRGVAWTDTVQGIFMLIAYIAGCVWVASAAFGGIFNVFSEAAQKIPEGLYLPGFKGAFTPQFWTSLWITITFGMAVMPHIWIRYYAGKSLRIIKWAAVFTAAYLTYLYIFTPALGLTAKLLYPDYATPDKLVPVLLLKYTPFAFAAFVMAGALAAALSTADSQLHAVSTILTVDIYKTFVKPEADERYLYNVERWIVIGLGVIVALISFTRPGLFLTILTMATAGTAALFPVFVAPLFWKRVTSKAALASVVVGETVVALTTYVWKNPLGIAAGAWGFTIAWLILIIVSMATKPEKSVEECVSFLKTIFG